jgi:hypothetical protein
LIPLARSANGKSLYKPGYIIERGVSLIIERRVSRTGLEETLGVE